MRLATFFLLIFLAPTAFAGSAKRHFITVQEIGSGHQTLGGKDDPRRPALGDLTAARSWGTVFVSQPKTKKSKVWRIVFIDQKDGESTADFEKIASRYICRGDDPKEEAKLVKEARRLGAPKDWKPLEGNL